MKFFRWFLLFPLLSATVQAKTRASHAASANGSFTGAIVIEGETGQVLFEENADASNPPASMTKLMTYAVLHDKLADGSLTLQTPVKVDASDAKMGGTQVYLDPRETFPVEELLYAMMIQSANDAAHALARTAAGSVEAFVGLMNAKARELGMTRTTFRSPHGLPPASRHAADGDLTTPRDFALLCRYLVQHTDVLKYTSVRERDFGPARADGPQHMRNHNNLLGKVSGVDGLKTGYTASAGYCLSATGQRNGRRVIVVIMGAFGPGRAVDKGKFRDLKAIEMMEQGFAELPARVVRTGPASPAAPGAETVAARPATTQPEALPTVKTEPAAAAEPHSTAAEPMFTFRVTPPAKKP